MPFGPWPDLDACLLDPKMLEAYPDDEARRRVCGSLKAKLDHGQDAGPAAVLETAGDAATIVHLDADKAILRDAVAAAAVVNDNSQWKPWSELEAAAPSLEGVPFVWEHPSRPGGPPGTGPGGKLVKHPERAPGRAVNVRLDRARNRIDYDLVLWRKPQAGADVGAEDLQRNELAIAHVQAGGRIHNSVGYLALFVPEQGTATGSDGKPKAYDVVQRRIAFDHVAGLGPIIGGAGACPLPTCGVGADAQGNPHACQGGDGCCKRRLQGAVDRIVQEQGCTEAEAVAAIVAAGKGS